MELRSCPAINGSGITGDNEMLSTIVIVLLILLLIGALPTWPYSAEWGYAPGGVLGTVLVVVLILALFVVAETRSDRRCLVKRSGFGVRRY
jgi:membrane protein YdbS with pleckstrin-like domain